MFSITWRIGDIGRKDSNDRSIKCTGKLSRRRKGRGGERERERGKGRREGGGAEDPWVKNDGQKGKPQGPGFYYGQPVASPLERFSWNRDKRHRQLKYPILIAAEIAGRRRHEDRHRRFNPPCREFATGFRQRFENESIPLAERYAPTTNDLVRASIPNRTGPDRAEPLAFCT